MRLNIVNLGELKKRWREYVTFFYKRKPCLDCINTVCAYRQCRAVRKTHEQYDKEKEFWQW